MAEKKSGKERRKYLRLDDSVKVDVRAQVKDKDAIVTESMLSISKNVSFEGICFTHERQFDAGSLLGLDIHIPGTKAVHLEGEVRWSLPIDEKTDKPMFRTGMKLYILDKSDETRFLMYVCGKMADYLNKDKEKT
jgi:hypothetical protein